MVSLTNVDAVLQALRDQLLADPDLGYQDVFLVDGIVEGVYPQVAAAVQQVTFDFDSQQRDLCTAQVTLRLVSQYADGEDGEHRIRLLAHVLRWWLIQHRLLPVGTPPVNQLQASRVRQIAFRTLDLGTTDWLHVAELAWWCRFLVDSTQPPVVPPPDPGPDPRDTPPVEQRIIRLGPPPGVKAPVETIQDPPPP